MRQGTGTGLGLLVGRPAVKVLEGLAKFQKVAWSRCEHAGSSLADFMGLMCCVRHVAQTFRPAGKQFGHDLAGNLLIYCTLVVFAFSLNTLPHHDC